MKVNVDYTCVESAIEKLSSNKSLTEKERHSIIILVNAVKGDYIPTHEETIQYRLQCEQFKKVDYEKNPTKWDRLMNILTVYENKYC
jgi:hypothetical protein